MEENEYSCSQKNSLTNYRRRKENLFFESRANALDTFKLS